jgi:hypothetical protein
MRRSLNISVLFLLTGISVLNAQNIDTAINGISLYVKAGAVYDYPFYKSRSGFTPTAEAGVNFFIDNVQIGVGLGYFNSSTHWYELGGKYTSDSKGYTQANCIYMPLRTNIRLFNIKKNILSVHVGAICVFLLNGYTIESDMNSHETANYDEQPGRFGLTFFTGLKYARVISRNLLLTYEMNLNGCSCTCYCFRNGLFRPGYINQGA